MALSELKLKPGTKIMMMGTREEEIVSMVPDTLIMFVPVLVIFKYFSENAYSRKLSNLLVSPPYCARNEVKLFL